MAITTITYANGEELQVEATVEKILEAIRSARMVGELRMVQIDDAGPTIHLNVAQIRSLTVLDE